MAFAKINKSGCVERHGNVQVRIDFYLEEKDPRYEDCLTKEKEPCPISTRHTNSAEKSTAVTGSWVKLKETKLGADVLSLNIDVQGKGAGSADPYAKLAIYKNGSLKQAHVNMTSAYKT